MTNPARREAVARATLHAAMQRLEDAIRTGGADLIATEPNGLHEGQRLIDYKLVEAWTPVPGSGDRLLGRLIAKTDMGAWGVCSVCQFKTDEALVFPDDFPVYLSPHWHPYPEVLLLAFGQATTFVGDRSYFMQKYESIYIPGKTVHNARIDTPAFVHAFLIREPDVLPGSLSEALQ